MNNTNKSKKTSSNNKIKKPSTNALAIKHENEEDYVLKALGGRPKKEIDKELFERLCSILCTHEEITNVLNVSKKTLNLWLRKTYHATFSTVYNIHASAGKASLRRTLHNQARTDSKVAMFLARTELGYLEEKEKRQLEQNQKIIDAKITQTNTEDAPPVKIEFVIKDETDNNRVARIEEEIKNANKSNDK